MVMVLWSVLQNARNVVPLSFVTRKLKLWVDNRKLIHVSLYSTSDPGLLNFYLILIPNNSDFSCSLSKFNLIAISLYNEINLWSEYVNCTGAYLYFPLDNSSALNQDKAAIRMRFLIHHYK